MQYLATLDANKVVKQIIVIPDEYTTTIAVEKLGITDDVMIVDKDTSAIGFYSDGTGVFRPWTQADGAGDDVSETGASGYPKDFVVWHGDKFWISLLDINVWEPGVSGWRVVGAAPDWAQPTGAHDAYQLGDEVTFGGSVWVSGYNANVWQPGVFGWTLK